MNRIRLNFLVDVTAFVLAILLASTGFVLKFMLPAGSGRLIGEVVGRHTGNRPVAFLWGMTRHDWGEVHFCIAIALMGILCIHLLLHWRWIIGVIGNQPTPERSRIRLAFGVLALLILISFAAAPFISDVRWVPRDGMVIEKP